MRSKGNPNLVPRCPLYPRPAVGNGKVPIPDRCSRVTRVSGNEIEVLLSTKDWIELPIELQPNFLKPSAPYWRDPVCY